MDVLLPLLMSTVLNLRLQLSPNKKCGVCLFQFRHLIKITEEG